MEITPEEWPLLSLLCLRLDGLPLALELAAAELRTHSLSEVVQRLEQRLSALTGGNRVAEPRQQTLRATIGWSYDLLSATEKMLFAQLALFHAGWSAKQAGELCGDPHTVRALLDRLVDKSLVVAEVLPRGTRYRFLDTLLEFATERLDELPAETVRALRRKHLDIFFSLARSGSGTNDAQKLAWARQLDPEHDNLRQALAFCRDDQPERSLEFCNALGSYWELRIFYGEQREQCETALECSAHLSRATPERGRTLYNLAYACKGLGDWDAARAALNLMSEQNLAQVLSSRRQALLALLAMNVGDLDESLQLFHQAVVQARSEEITLDIRFALSNMAQVLMLRGELVQARAALEECRSSDSFATRTGVVVLDLNFIQLDILEGKLQGVPERLRSVLQVFLLMEKDLVDYLCACGMFASRVGDARYAAQLFGASFSWCESQGEILEEPERTLRERDMAQLRTDLGECDFEAAFAVGRAWSREQLYAQLTV